MNRNPLFPDVTVILTGRDGNAFSVLGSVQDAMRRAGIDKKTISEYLDEAMSGDYDHLLRTTMKYVDVQ